jgi:hypothetical protein
MNLAEQGFVFSRSGKRLRVVETIREQSANPQPVDRIFRRWLNLFERWQPIREIGSVVQEFGSRSALDLEMGSTLVYVDRFAAEEGNPISVHELVRKVRNIKPHLDIGG